ncbi:serine hydrolase-like protein isoform X2 [Anticarsia gemmatalis]|uniref:serine hydrolase-like protein isoform X2 n=1 Tax=Anticarsia gemmatalis TaxID=129554 RepID=UPI003F76ED22
MKCAPLRTWKIKAPWGQLSLTSWGNPNSPPVFLVHGRQDCAATFQPLLQLLPQEYYFVAIDMPGSGPSDPLPNGIKIMRFHFLGAMEVAIEHLGWKSFIFIGHSMGCEQGLFFNSLYPGRITKMILLDAEPTLRRLQVQNLAEYQPKFYNDYYDNYWKENYYYRTYTKPQATEALMKARNLTEDKASVLLSTSLIHVKDDQYRFSWDRRLKMPAPQNYPNTYYFALFKNIPKTLLISASESIFPKTQAKAGSLELIGMMSKLSNFSQVIVEGDHDVHLSYPERVAPYAAAFLTENIVLASKL